MSGKNKTTNSINSPLAKILMNEFKHKTIIKKRELTEWFIDKQKQNNHFYVNVTVNVLIEIAERCGKKIICKA